MSPEWLVVGEGFVQGRVALGLGKSEVLHYAVGLTETGLGGEEVPFVPERDESDGKLSAYVSLDE